MFEITKLTDLFTWRRAAGLAVTLVAVSTLLWPAVAALSWVLSRGSTYVGSLLNPATYGWAWLAAALLVAVAFWLYFRKSGGASDEKGARWLPQREFEKGVIVAPAEEPAKAACWTVGGIGKGGEKTYRILAEDKKIARDKLGLEEKRIDPLAAGSSLVLGAAGSNKTSTVIIPTVLTSLLSLSRPTLVVTDPKGELFAATSGTALGAGYKVFRLDTTASGSGDSWNFLSEVWDVYHEDYLPAWKGRRADPATPTDRERNARVRIEQIVSQAVEIIAPIPKNPGSNSYFYQTGQTLVKAYLLIPLDYGASREQYTPYACAVNASLYGPVLQAMVEQLPEWSIARQYAAQLAEGADHGGVRESLSQALTYLDFMTGAAIQKLTSADTIDLSSGTKDPTVYYVGMDPAAQESAESRIATLFMGTLYRKISAAASKAEGGFLKRPVHYVVDEFGNLPRMDFIPKIFSLDRGKNIMALCVVQSRSQLLETYGQQRTKEIFDSAQALIVCSIAGDVDLAGELSRRAGQSYRKSVSHSISDKGSTRNESEQQRKDVDDAEFINKKSSEFIVFLANRKPFKFQFVPFWRTSWAQRLAEAPENQGTGRRGSAIGQVCDFGRELVPVASLSYWAEKNLRARSAARSENAEAIIRDRGGLRLKQQTVSSLDDYKKRNGSLPMRLVSEPFELDEPPAKKGREQKEEGKGGTQGSLKIDNDLSRKRMDEISGSIATNPLAMRNIRYLKRNVADLLKAKGGRATAEAYGAHWSAVVETLGGAEAVRQLGEEGQGEG